MKRIVFFLGVILITLSANAQMKVAILETVDKAQNVNYGVKLLLRSSLTAAISNTNGYEGYDRVDMASIASEQEFQRTGNVSDDQIQQIGRAAGAAYILVAEAAKYDATSIIITAKLIDVVTFGVKSSAVLVSGVGAAEMQETCNKLSAKLLNAPQNVANKNTAQKSNREQNVQQYQPQISQNRLVQISSKEYEFNGQMLKEQAYTTFLQKNCTAAYSQWQNGKKKVKTGWWLFSAGLVAIPTGIVCMNLSYYNINEYGNGYDDADINPAPFAIGITLLSAGVVTTVVSIPILLRGYKKRNTAYEVFNEQCSRQGRQPLTLNFTAGPQSVGLALKF